MKNKDNSKYALWAENCSSWLFHQSETLSVKLEQMAPETKEKLHLHYLAQQFFFILKGTATFYINDQVEKINAYEGIAVPPNTPHYIANESSVDLEFLVISEPNTDRDRINL